MSLRYAAIVGFIAVTSCAAVAPCAVGSPLDSGPAFVVLAPDASEWKSTLTDALAFWTRARGPLLLDGGVLDVKPIGSIIVVQSYPLPIGTYGQLATEVRGCRHVSTSVRLSPSTPFEVRGRTLTHELGHVLGLPDSMDPGSVMYFQASPGPYGP